MIENQRKEVEEISKEYVTFIEQNAKEVRAIQKIKIRNQNTENEVSVVREYNSRKKFTQTVQFDLNTLMKM